MIRELNAFNGYADFEVPDQEQAPITTAANGEVIRWLKEPCIPKESTPEQVTLYLQSKVFDFLLITQIARDFLVIPATSAPSERVFSLAGNLISKKRTKITSENVRYILCLQS